jgi:exodeoxyribonuclease-3
MPRLPLACGLAIFALCLLTIATRPATGAETLRVMSYNMWHGGESGGQPLEQSTNVIKAAKADIVGLQESHGERRRGIRPDNGRLIAERLSWNHFDQGDEDTGVVSRYRILEPSPKKWGVQIETPSGRRVWLFNVHFAHAPYQPYQLLKIPYEDAPFIESADEAVREARKARQLQVAAMLEEAQVARRQGEPVFITGDFNEPPALDWTAEACQAKRCPIAVRWPTTGMLLDAGYVDAYRECHADPVKFPGFTWTPITAENDPNDRHDRIDFVFVGGPAKVVKTEIIGERPERADIVVTPYPSDHRAVVATITLQ